MEYQLSHTQKVPMQGDHNCDVSPGHINSCQVCGSNDIQQIIDLGFSAPCDSLLTKSQLKEMERTYPLNLERCRTCGLVQIDYAVDPKDLFYPEYPYRSGITDVLRKNLHGTSKRVADKVKLQKGSLVVDIGSNDGTILEGFRDIGMKVLGVEPTNIADIANASGIETLKQFFSLETVGEIRGKHGPAALATAANVFAHVNNLSSLLNGVRDLLSDDGVFVTESHYMMDILETLQYDSVYHEHLRFYFLKPLVNLFHQHGFTLIDVENIPNYGGSIRVYAQKGLGRTPSQEVGRMIRHEEEQGAYKDATFQKFASKIQDSRRNLRSLIVKLADEKKSVVGIGCPGRAVTLLTCCGLTQDLLPYIAEQSTSLKLGLYTPGTHIPVVDEERLFREQPEYALILSWHYADPIIASLRKRGLKSKIIVPLPDIRIVD